MTYAEFIEYRINYGMGLPCAKQGCIRGVPIIYRNTHWDRSGIAIIPSHPNIWRIDEGDTSFILKSYIDGTIVYVKHRLLNITRQIAVRRSIINKVNEICVPIRTLRIVGIPSEVILAKRRYVNPLMTNKESSATFTEYLKRKYCADAL